nr:unnamed protein product [Digitaria exilis]
MITAGGGGAWSGPDILGASGLDGGAQVSAAQVGPLVVAHSGSSQSQLARGAFEQANSATRPLARAMTSSCSLSSSASSSSASESESDGSQSRTARGDGDGDGSLVPSWSSSAAERNGWRSSCSQVHRWPASRRRHLSRKSRHASDRHAGIAGRFPPNPTRSSSSPTSPPASSDQGRLPVRSSSAVHPRDQTSDAGVTAPPRATSGAIHAGVPRGPRGASSETSLAAPKSASFAPPHPLPRRTFRPLTSPWTTPASSWRYRSAAATLLRTPRAARSPRPPICLAAASAADPPGTSSMCRHLVPAAVSPSPRYATMCGELSRFRILISLSRHASAAGGAASASTDFTAKARPEALSTARCTAPNAPLPMHFPRSHSMSMACVLL